MPQTELDQDQVRAFYGALQAVRVAVDVNVALSGIQNLGGDIGADGHRVLLIGQTDPTESGVWIMRASDWERADDALLGFDLGGMLVPIMAGNDSGELWRISNQVGSGIVGTNAILAAEQASPETSVVFIMDSVGSFATNSVSYVPIGLEFTAPADGDYSADFSCHWYTSRGSREAYFVISKNGTPISSTERQGTATIKDARKAAGTIWAGDLVAGDVLTVEARSEDTGSTVTIENATLVTTY